MEESYLSARRRPDSPASTNTRMTPSSSNNSSANLPGRTGRETPTFRASSAAAGSLLQERLALRKRERRGSLDARERDVQSSPVRGPERPRSSSGKGVKSTEEQLQTLMKTNFDLKLELFHRRNKMAKMEEELAESQAQQQETMDVNDQLLEELKTRDLALDEAIAMISDLEEKVARLTQDRHDAAAFDQDYFSSQNDGIASSPPPKRLPRMPSFLSENSEGTENLRSLYAPYSFSGDLPKLSEEEQDSPRLSVLSESSFLSVYGKKEPELPYLSLDETEPRRSSDVKKWVEERPEVTPARRKGGDRIYLSLDQCITSPLQRLEKMGNLNVNTQPMKSFDRALPPTPDTFSTNTLRSRRETGSTDTLNANSTDVNFMNFPNKSHFSERPRSAGETITSRREGHGWDTQTETDGSIVSTVDISYQHLPREVGPIFSFASNDWGNAGATFKPEVPAHRRMRRSSLTEEPRSDDTVRTVTRADAAYGSSPLDNTTQPELPNRRSSLYANMKKRTQSTDQSSNSAHSKSPSNVVFSNSPSSTIATPGAGTTPTPKRNRLASLGIFKRVEQPQFESSPAPRPKPISRETYAHSRHSSRDESGASTPPPIRRNRTQPQAPGHRPSSAGGERSREKARDILEETREKRRERRGSFTVGGTMGVMVQEKELGPEEVEESGKKGVRKWLGLASAGRAGNLRR